MLPLCSADSLLSLTETKASAHGILAKAQRHVCAQEIKTELTRFKGVGKKTVACVLMFCLDRQGISCGVCTSATLCPFACPSSDPSRGMISMV